MNKVQHATSATGKECKMEILKRVKVQHEIQQYIKRVQLEKILTKKGGTWKWRSMKKVEHVESAT